MGSLDIENRAGLARVTCGWARPELELANVRPYWRDVHSPAIARRAGVFEYRHYPLDPVRSDLFAPRPGIESGASEGEQLMWLSDVRYLNESAMDAFGLSPGPEQKAKILADIELIVDKSTTYKVIGKNGRTLIDRTGDPKPSGPAASPTFAVFFRQRSDQASFRSCVRALGEAWAAAPGVLRLRSALFEVPDMEAERRSGYPVKTHPPDQQYQAWFDLVLESETVASGLLSLHDDLADHVHTVHAYPAPAVYTFNCDGVPTLTGLRGFSAHQAIQSLGAEHQRDPGLLSWMYGAFAKPGGIG